MSSLMRMDRNTGWLFFVFWLTPVIFLVPRPSTMSMAVLQTSVNIVDTGSFEISPSTATDLINLDEKFYSGFGPGGAVLAAPFYMLTKPVIANLSDKLPEQKGWLNHAARGVQVTTKEVYYLHIVTVCLMMAPLFALLLLQCMQFAEKKVR